ncbi:hypothetical protein ACFYXM_29845 [Streptomyces sp. NPDC002476]|uniref:hypothetical protein n=1 Tax=Streptomyces sp. NPDC002476 TaxID=3364648 RepID=UPI0036A29EAE
MGRIPLRGAAHYVYALMQTVRIPMNRERNRSAKSGDEEVFFPEAGSTVKIKPCGASSRVGRGYGRAGS